MAADEYKGSSCLTPYLVLDERWNIQNLLRFPFPMVIPVIGTHATNSMHAPFFPPNVVLTVSGIYEDV